MADDSRGQEPEPEVVVIKKYANRRLYNMNSSSYVTLDHLCQMVRDGQDFVVRDAKTGDDITRQLLTQIIVEQEAKGQNMLPESFLRRLIQLYGDNLQAFVPRYLELAMESFARNQDDVQARMNRLFGGGFPVGELEAMRRHNVELMQRTIDMFKPFGGGHDGAGPAPGNREETAGDVATLHDKLDALKAQLDALSEEPRKSRR